MAQRTTKRHVPQSVKRLILLTPGASSRIAERAGCSRSLVSLALRGRRNCTQRLWNAIVDWLAEPRTGLLVDMARHELQARPLK